MRTRTLPTLLIVVVLGAATGGASAGAQPGADPAPAPPPAEAPPTAPPDAPPPVDAEALAALEAARVAAEREVVAAQNAAAVQIVTTSLDTATTSLTVATTTMAAATAETAAARSVLATATARLDAAAEERSAAGDALEAATGELEDAQTKLSNVAVEAFTSAGASTDPGVSSTAARTDPDVVADESMRSSLRSASASAALAAHREARSVEAAARERQSAAVKAHDDAKDRVDAAKERTATAAAAMTAAEDALSATQADLEAASALLVAVRERGADALASAGRGTAPGAATTGGLSLLGPTIVSAEDMAAFVRSRGGAHPTVDVEELAELFVEEGKAYSVRADLAWVQSIIETGGFSYRNSMVEATDYNYAGIGACDSCRRGFIYPSPRLGARAQMQLLAIYATPQLTSEQLPHPPARSTPERVSVRGCCQTWMELSGVWATGPGYGVKILTLYNQLLSFAANRKKP